ncbi:uncharacterized protein A1O9_01058 [Exophiala aquamarina CBS 119918]|uniref:J domain-containing protein n=1 Tax=Exophiala aquamarina CBS 119918 TaxID=1182545 RepID=A0A072PTJ9_9EURO|nr:uncharacterized protein A1O9_01058 [Exophiala aquamarina CBS 119918]KEF63082.1 hypothetical protein A1O9_01058 [Exophiala aquamarina CBS 119918]
MRPRILHFLTLCTLLCLVAAWSKEDYEIFKLKDEVDASEGQGVTFYDFLGVKSSSTVDEISKAFRKKSRALHPDKAKHSFVASRSTSKPTQKPGEKKKPAVHVSKGPSDRELQKFLKQATERYQRLGVVANILKGPERERYDFFLQHGFPTWRGTGYYYSRYRPGLGTVLTGLFLVVGGAAHYFVLITSYKRQREFMERYIKHARKTAWGDESGISGLAAIGQPVDVPQTHTEPEADPMANLNRRQKREMERQNKKDKSTKTKPARPAPVPASSNTGDRRRVTAENGKILVVDSEGNVFLEEEDEDGETQEYLLDLDEIPRPTFRDTAVVRFPVWLFRKAFDPFLKNTEPIPSRESLHSEEVHQPRATPEVVVSGKATPPGGSDLSASQISDSGFEIVDSTGIENEIANVPNAKKRGKKGKK